MDQQADRLEFAVPDDIDIDEQPPESPLFVDSDELPPPFQVGPVPNPTLERLRDALGADHRWVLRHVEPDRSLDKRLRKLVTVWVRITAYDERRELLPTTDAIEEIVKVTIPGAFLARVSLAPRPKEAPPSS